MKKTTQLFILFIGVSLLSAGSLVAQDFVFGLKAGPSVSGIKVKRGVADDSKLGFHAGTFGMVEITDKVFLQPEALLSFQGDEVTNLTHLNFPIVVKYFFTDEFSAHAGIQVGVLLFGERDVEDILKTADLGIPFGAEYQINDSFGLGARYVVGVTDIIDSDINTNQDWFNRVFQLFVTYRLN